MKRFLFALSTFLIAVLFAFTSCDSDDRPPKADPAFITYIRAFTGDVVSNQAGIRVELVQKHLSARPGQALTEEVFSFSPKINGTTYWLDEKTIEFKPDQPFPSGQFYKAIFHLGKLIDVEQKLTDFNFAFQVMKQNFEIDLSGMESYTETERRWIKIKGSFYSYDNADDVLLKSAVEAFQDGRKLSISWDHHPGGRAHHFTIDSVKRSMEVSEVEIQWNMARLGADQSEITVFEIPPIDEFKVLDVKTLQGEQSFVEISFSDPLYEGQDLSGLVWFVPQLISTISTDGNTLKVYPKQSVEGSYELKLSSSIKNFLNNKLKQEYAYNITFNSLKPAVELIGKGNILPSSTGLTLPFKAVNLKAVDIKIIKIYQDNIQQFLQTNQLSGVSELKRVGRMVYKGELVLNSDEAIDYGRWNNFGIDLSDFIDVDPGSIYRVVLSFNQNQSLYNCKEDSEENDFFTEDVKLKDDDFWDNSSNYWYYYDYSNYERSNYYGYFRYDDRGNPCKLSYYLDRDKVRGVNVLASDLGIIAKGNNSGYLAVAVTNLNTTEPMQDVDIEIYNFQQQLIGTSRTDNRGFTTIELSKKPFLLIAKKNRQYGYLRLDHPSVLSMSMFDVGGQRNEQGLKGYIYGERGVWRPGDSLYLSFMLEDRYQSLPQGHPVIFELYNPQRQLIDKKVNTSPVDGIYDFRTATPQDAPTGYWKAMVKVGGSEFTKVLKVETVKPNRLKMNLDFGKDILTSDGDNKAKLEVKWLHGATAGDLKSSVEMVLSPATHGNFERYNDYSFKDNSKRFYSYPEMVFDGKLNKDGKAEIDLNIKNIVNAPGILMAYFTTRAFEKGGEFSIDRKSILYSPYNSYVGVKVPEGEGWRGALFSDKEQIIPIVTLDEKGSPVDRENLTIEIYDIYWRWWWENSTNEDFYDYVANKHSYLVKTDTISTKKGKAMYKMNLDGRHYGRRYIRIIDNESGHSCGKDFYVTYSGWYNSGENPGGAEMLTFNTNKDKYEVGETIEVQVPTAKNGRVLVSLETGSQVLKQFWMQFEEGSQTIKFKATEEMSPNFYVHLSLIQPHDQSINDLPIRMYGVQPVFVENKNSHLNPKISMPDVLRPESSYDISISELDGKPMAYTLAVVDEGLLDLTSFKTPSPWNHFNKKEALSVRTWDMYQYVIGAYSGKMSGLLAIGGDEDGEQENQKAKANRFKPVVSFLGPFKLEAGEVAKHSLKMPNYVGAVRTMVVAKKETAYGNVDYSSKVKKPLMVLASLPRVLGPDEEVVLPVTVFAMDDKIKKVKVKVETNDLLINKGAKTKTITFDKQGDQVVNFNLKVGDQIGIATLNVEVNGSGEKANYQIELDIRAPNPLITDVESIVLVKDEEISKAISSIGIEGTNTEIIEISTFPPINLEKRLKYLISYPHGCIEQTTSAAFPQLYLHKFVDLSPRQKSDLQENIITAINRIRKFQLIDGSFSYWPGSDYSNYWGTSYAGHFLLEAKALGYDLPPGMLHNWKSFQKQAANNWTNEHDYYSKATHQLMQAYRLYTLALANNAQLGAMNRMRNMENISIQARYRLAAAYLLIGKKEIAEKLIANRDGEIQTYNELSGTFGSDIRDKAMMLETFILLEKKEEIKIILDELSRSLSSDSWLSTQTTAWSLLSISKMLANEENDRLLSFNYKLNNQSTEEVNTKALYHQIKLNETNKTNSVHIVNNGGKTLFVRIYREGIPLVGDTTNAENGLELNVKYLNLAGEKLDPSKIKQGIDFTARVTLKNTGLINDYKEMALTQIFPSGWEIRNARMDQGYKQSNMFNYQDIRDDRVLTYFDLKKGETKTFDIKINATYRGAFYLPTVYCEAMYNQQINARKAGQWIEVVE
jgi:uncharacterized protein YfaS (alpha-2-macroglobulin family)